MTLLIDVGTVLRGTVCDLYSNLVTRPTGAAVRNAIEQQVRELDAPAVTTIDFSQVSLLDFSCADEIVAKLLLHYRAEGGPAGFLLFAGIQDDHVDPIETVLAHHRLALVSWFQGSAELFGCVDDAERLHWETVRDHGPMHSGDVAIRLHTGDAESRSMLEQLRLRRLLMLREEGYLVPAIMGRAT